MVCVIGIGILKTNLKIVREVLLFIFSKGKIFIEEWRYTFRI